ncbi:MAG: tRNA glutamyl-Q(34) synthetase GluQRS [Aestuariivirgaceae bacterium]|nr:tRNA glutamyl-Q(34) synthetase GluQRS [Aestuariivirgaceae bacterium]
MVQPIFRFAPSPNGPLHMGHAFSALFGARAAARAGGLYLLRIEDIDTLRCREGFIADAVEILDWLGVRFDGALRRQSAHMDDYARAIAALQRQGLLYPCHCTRSGLSRDRLDPDGAPLHAGRCAPGSGPFALRLDMARALQRGLSFLEASDARMIEADPALWGDVVIARKDIGTSYHLSVVVDDALQGVTHVTRGRDLFMATHVHRLLQALLGLPTPIYHHHDLIRDDAGRKLSKSDGDKSLAALWAEGVTAAELRAALGF